MKMKIPAISLLLFLCFQESFTQDVPDMLMKARAYKETGDLGASEKVLSDGLKNLSDWKIYLERAEIYAAQGDYSAAVRDLNEANKLNPSSGDYGLARIYSFKGDVNTALYHLEMNLKSSWKKSEKEIMLEPAFRNIENRPEWKNFWKKERYTGLERKLSELEFYASSGKKDEASVTLAELKSDYPNATELLYGEAVLALASGRNAEAARFAAGAVDKNPFSEKYLRLLARAQEASSNPAGASETYTKLLDAGINDASLLVARAGCYRKTGENRKALSDIERYLGYYPGNSEAISLAGKLEAVEGDNIKALELFSRNIELHPDNPVLYIDRGDAYLSSRSWDRAVKDYSMSLDLQPGSPQAWLNKGIALLNMGRKSDACFDFRKALSLGNKRASEFINRNCLP